MAGTSKRTHRKRRAQPNFGERIEPIDHTLEELHEIATELKIEGRSSMSKVELANAINEVKQSQGDKRPE